jgi:uncharacterized membrane protein (UPF0127 family)
LLRPFLAYLSRFSKYALIFLVLGWVVQALWFHSLPRTNLQIGPHPVRAVLAATPRRRAWGLMLRLAVANGQGMLFVYPSPRRICMWMMYTFVPLSIAFIRQDGVISNLNDMEPLTRQSHCAIEPVLYALEVPQGWFAAHSVTLGDEVSDLPQPTRD